MRVFLLLLITMNAVYSQRCEYKDVKLEIDSFPKLEMRNEVVIPLVFHIFENENVPYISVQDIFNQIDFLNLCFSGEIDYELVPVEFRSIIGKSKFRFCLASKVENGIIKEGIIRISNLNSFALDDNIYSNALGGSDSWDHTQFLNIRVIIHPLSLQGTGTFPTSVSNEKDGVTIAPAYLRGLGSKRYGQGKVLVHEIGHYLGLYHPFEGGCNIGDLVLDTPPQENAFLGCPKHPQLSCNSERIPFMNYMDYVDDPCMFFFTKGQVERMEKTVIQYRSTLTIAQENICSLSNSELPKVIVKSPSNNFKFFLLNNNLEYRSKISIFNLIGQQVWADEVSIKSGFELNLPLVSGVYFIKVFDQIVKCVLL
jgi:hypothetical protein